MASDAVARRYAHALFEIGQEHGKLKGLRDELDSIAAAFGGSDEFRRLLLHPGIETDERRSAIRTLAESWGLDEMLVNFVFLLLDNERVRKLPAIAEVYRGLVDEEAGHVRATVTSAVELDGGEKRALKDVIGEMTGKEVILTTEIDESIIGGAITRIGGVVYDGSVRNQLENLKENILQEV